MRQLQNMMRACLQGCCFAARRNGRPGSGVMIPADFAVASVAIAGLARAYLT